LSLANRPDGAYLSPIDPTVGHMTDNQPDEAWPPILIVPGLFNSAPDHWQSHWERTLPGAERVLQENWDLPTLGEWTANLLEAVRGREGAVIVAHSLGCAVVAHLARISACRGIGGALLVAPAEVNRKGPVGALLNGFSPMPRTPLPFPSTVVASRNDPHVALDQAAAFAKSWGFRFVDLGEAGHINVQSGHGPWTEGLELLGELIGRVEGRLAEPRIAQVDRALLQSQRR
jgi:predicted alpha/beta hydrolase family esterase